MGTYTFYISSKNAEECQIDWDSMNTEVLFKFRPLERCYKKCTTLNEVGLEMNESKLFGYMSGDLIAALYEFNAHLINKEYDLDIQGPTLYFEWEGGNIAYALEFFPNSNTIYYHRLDYDDLVKNSMPLDEYNKIIESLPNLDGWTFEVL